VDRFEMQVVRHPDRVAIKTPRREIRYCELNALANGIARWCLHHEAGGERVALLLDHDELTIATLLGILKSGKTYVPVDPGYPLQRIEYIANDSQAGLLLTNSRNLPLARRIRADRLQIVPIDETDFDISEDNLRLTIAPEALASIYYTSGSTGQPKGVTENHRNRLLNASRCTNSLNICGNDSLTLLYSVAFASSVTDIFCALLNGASLSVYDVKQHGIAGLPQALAQHQVTIYHSTPSVFRQFVSALPPGNSLPALRLIRLASEQLRPSDIVLYRENFARPCLLGNTWGATEAPCFQSALFDQQTEFPDGAIPIVGYPVDDDELSLRDECGAEVAPGETGEIVVRSRYLSPGYWGRPELTSQRMQPDPDDPSRRIYRTGDLGQFLPDGRLVYRGRTDFQAKIRGYRVEFMEVELALQSVPGIEESVVVAHENGTGSLFLVAYVAAGDKVLPAVDEIRRSVADTLPHFMIPSHIVPLDRLPRNAHGKIDRSSLPAPQTGERPSLEIEYYAPRTEVERRVAAIWQEVLGLQRIGIHDKFSDLGGDSLQANQVVIRIVEAFGVELRISELWKAPTIADTALRVVQDLARQLPSHEQRRLCAGL
jgi:amino acid adenylation domain-containing protein